jgi:hypothetical protein
MVNWINILNTGTETSFVEELGQSGMSTSKVEPIVNEWFKEAQSEPFPVEFNKLFPLLGYSWEEAHAILENNLMIDGISLSLSL